MAKSRLERNKQKFPKAYKRMVARAGKKVADELFAHISEKKNA